MPKSYARRTQEQKEAVIKATNKKRRANPAKSIIISFRVKPQVLAHGLEGLLQYDPNIECDKLSKIGKALFRHGLNTVTANLPRNYVSNDTRELLEAISDRIKINSTSGELVSTNRLKEHKLKYGAEAELPKYETPTPVEQNDLERQLKQQLDNMGYRENNTKTLSKEEQNHKREEIHNNIKKKWREKRENE